MGSKFFSLVKVHVDKQAMCFLDCCVIESIQEGTHKISEKY